MASLLLPILFLMSLFFCASSMQDFFGDNTVNIYDKDYKHPSNASIWVGKPGFRKEIIIANYYSSDDLEYLLRRIKRFYSPIMEVHWGTPKGMEVAMWAVHISRDVQKDRPITKPMFKYVANIHGDDAVGYALMVSLIQYLVYSYGIDSRITEMLDNIDIWIVPNANAYGFSISNEGSCETTDDYNLRLHGIKKDIDEDFPHENWNKNRFRRQESETLILTNFILDHPFVLSGNLQGGAIVASYPLDNFLNMGLQRTGNTRDDDKIEKLALEYAQNNFMMAPGDACNQTFTGGITNGYKWKNKTGGTQDFNYFHSNCFELTFHLSCCKYPNRSHLPFYWNANLESMLKFIESTRRGVYGLVKDEMKNKPIVNAAITVEGKGKVIKVTKNGEYWRLLNIGVYNVTASAPRFESQTERIDVNSTHPYVYHDFILKLKRRNFLEKLGVSCLH